MDRGRVGGVSVAWVGVQVKTGQAEFPENERVEVFPVKVEEDAVLIDIS